MPPHVNDLYYVMISIFDSSLHYDQIGFSAYHGHWGVTWAALTGCGTTGTSGVDFDVDAFTLVGGLTYHFKMLLGGQNVTYSVSRGGFTLWQRSVNTGADFFMREGFTSCGFPPQAYPGYSNYIEIYDVEREAPPYWGFDFIGNKAGGAIVGSWSTYTDGVLPSTPNEPPPFPLIGTNSDVGSVFVWDEWFRVSTDVETVQISQGTTSAGAWVTVKLNQAGTWSTNCGTTCPVDLSASVPPGWSATFSPSSSTPYYLASITLTIPSTAAINSYKITAHAQRPSGLFTEHALIVKIVAAGGGGGCVAKNTMILTDQGYVKVQQLVLGDTLIGYDIQNITKVNLSLTYLTESRQSYMVDINNGALLLTALDQPIYAITAAGPGWVHDPVDLNVGDIILDADQGRWIEVSSVSPVEKDSKVYDVGTSGPNNFIANGFLLDQKE